MDNRVIRVLLALCDSVGTPRALSVAILARSGEYTQLQQLRCEPSSYVDPEAYHRDALVTEFLRKCDLPSDVDKEAAALQTFYACEAQCCETNARVHRFIPGNDFNVLPSDERLRRVVRLWRKEVRRLLGRLPDELVPRFSNGATFLDRGIETTIPGKVANQMTCYEHSTLLLPFIERTQWGAARLASDKSSPKLIRGNRFATVPKDAEKKRGICVEASANVSLQLDVGRHLRLRLKRIGIDLTYGQDLHRSLAQLASEFGSWVTIDLSNASDTIARLLVKLILPDEWYQLLDSLRATHTWVNGRWVLLEKFSSMGNGFTFELETVLFATLARVLAREHGHEDQVWVYGDDIIVTPETSRSLLPALRFFGFTPNKKKTFVEGPFRESCGGDFFSGMPVRAHYLKELPMEPQHWIALANGLQRIADATPWGHRYVNKARLRVLDQLPSSIRRLKGPKHLGDFVIHDDDDRNWCVRYDSNQTRFVRAWLPVQKHLNWDRFPAGAQLVGCLLGLPHKGPTPRGWVGGFREKWLPCDLRSSWLPSPS